MERALGTKHCAFVPLLRLTALPVRSGPFRRPLAGMPHTDEIRGKEEKKVN